MPGHLFIVRGSVTRLACDHVLIPSGVGVGGRLGEIRRESWRKPLGGLVDGDGFLRPDLLEHGQRVWRVRDGTSLQSPTLWVGHTGDSDQEPSWYAEAVGEYVRRAASAGAVDPTRRPLGDSRPLVALPLVGTGNGGAARRRGEVLAAIMERLREELDRSSVDVALVLNHDEGFAAAQHARRAAFAGSAWHAGGLSDQVSELVQHARRGHLVLFVGAGASAGGGLPNWQELLSALAVGSKPEVRAEDLAKLDARDAGAVLERRLGGKANLAERIMDLVTLDRVSVVHQLLASLPVSEIVTTNYDRGLEDAFADAGKPLRVLPRDIGSEGAQWLLKLHGSVDEPDRIVLSRDDYLQFEGDSAALAGIVQALLITRHMLFVGYSLQDDNFHRLFHEVRRAVGPGRAAIDRSRFATVLSAESGGLRQEIWEDDLPYATTAGVPEGAIRGVATFLDQLAADAAPVAAHMLDESYIAMFNADERTLRRELLDVWELVGRESADIPVAVRTAVTEALQAIGRVERPPNDDRLGRGPGE